MAGTHTAKAMLTFTAAELKLLINGMDTVRSYADTMDESAAMDALLARLTRALVAVEPR